MRWMLKPVSRGVDGRRERAPKLSAAAGAGEPALAGAGGAAPEGRLGLAFARANTGGEGGKAVGSGGGKPVSESDPGAQPSDKCGVPKDMATMVLDNSALGGTLALDPERASNPGVGARAELEPESDAALMLRLAAGEEACFTVLAEKYHRPMVHFLFRMVRNQAVAEELAQEVFLRVYRSRESYRAEAKFTTWLYRIATNLAVNYARDTRRERGAQTVYLDAPDEETGTTPDVADERPNVEQRLMRNERMSAIRAQVMALPERQRAAVLMHKYQGLDYRQIGEVLKLSESATKSLLFRAYQTLREKLKDFV
ncbi:MAG TPA: sigma-70 family RNA polymerase sigma factor [Terracidiphilus sp.]|nr:sigma-70 family RNA polymerase sigma factor [Terracidiphilus sp.]